MERGAGEMEFSSPVENSHDMAFAPHEISRNEETLEQAFTEIDQLALRFYELSKKIDFLICSMEAKNHAR